jgi:hypothetical protein
MHANVQVAHLDLYLDSADNREITKANLNTKLITRANVTNAMSNVDILGRSAAANVLHHGQIQVPFPKKCCYQVLSSFKVNRETGILPTCLPRSVDPTRRKTKSAEISWLHIGIICELFSIYFSI